MHKLYGVNTIVFQQMKKTKFKEIKQLDGRKKSNNFRSEKQSLTNITQIHRDILKHNDNRFQNNIYTQRCNNIKKNILCTIKHY